MKQAHDESKRADIAEKAALKETANEYKQHYESADVNSGLKTGKSRRKSDRRTNIAKIQPGKTHSEEQEHCRPFDHCKVFIESFRHGNALNTGFLSCSMKDILRQSHRAYKSAEQFAK